MTDRPLVFISCGQYTASERSLGNSLADAVNSLTQCRGYFADQVMSLDALSSGIFKALNSSVAFVAVMHHRGSVERLGSKIVRASVWVEQEVAVAAFMQYALGRKLVPMGYIQKGIALEGVREKLQLNPVSFVEDAEVINHFRSWLASGALTGMKYPTEANPNIRPNLQVEATTQHAQQIQQTWIHGNLTNEGKGVATEVRLTLIGMKGSAKFTSIAPNGKSHAFSCRLDDQPAFSVMPQWAGIKVEYYDDDGVKYEQQGEMNMHGPDNSGRITYTMAGLKRPTRIEKFTLRFHALEDL